jgi:hypothetical protein
MDRHQAINGIAVFSMLALLCAAGYSELMTRQSRSDSVEAAKIRPLREVFPTGEAPIALQGTPTASTPFLATPEITATPTLDLAATAALAPAIAYTIGDPTTNLRALPDTAAAVVIVAELAPNTPLPILGRWVGFDWLLVQWAGGPNNTAWVYLPLVRIEGDLNAVPAVEPQMP